MRTERSVVSEACEGGPLSVQMLMICWPLASVLKHVLKFLLSGMSGS
jgi:hypothetical protein